MGAGRKFSLDNNQDTISKAFGYDTMEALQKAFSNGELGEDAEFALKFVLTYQALPVEGRIFFSTLFDTIYDEDDDSITKMAETLTNAITDKDKRSKLETVWGYVCTWEYRI